MTKTESIRIADKAEASENELKTIARYLAKTTDKERQSYLRRNPRVKEALKCLR